MKARTVFAIFTFTLFPLHVAHGAIALTEFGGFTTTSYGDCTTPCNITDILSFNLGSGTGGKGIASTTQSVTGAVIGDSGTLFAEATILGGLSTPLLRASAESNAGKYTNIQGTGIQGYTVSSGGDNQTISANLHLTGSILNPQGNDLTGLTATAVLVKVSDPLDFLFENASLFLLSPDAVQLSQSTPGGVDLMGALNLTVNQGDQFYLVASLGAAAGGLDANAFSLSTFTVEFDALSASVLIPAAAVALPATVWLFTSAIIGLVGFGKRKTT